MSRQSGRVDIKFAKCSNCGVKLAEHGVGPYKDCTRFIIKSKGREVYFEENRGGASQNIKDERDALREAIRRESKRPL